MKERSWLGLWDGDVERWVEIKGERKYNECMPEVDGNQ